jgi:hypothetical protein
MASTAEGVLLAKVLGKVVFIMQASKIASFLPKKSDLSGKRTKPVICTLSSVGSVSSCDATIHIRCDKRSASSERCHSID